MLKILWFSPMPPARTDIANYTARLALPLCEKAETLFCYPDDTPCPGVWYGKPIGKLTTEEVNSADFCIYHIGNNAEFHGQIWECAVRHPGIVVLHDRAIHEFYMGYLGFWNGTADQAAVQKYFETMAYWYGKKGYVAAVEVLEGRMKPYDCAYEFPLYETVLEDALGVISHNPLVSAEVRQRFPLLPIIDLPLPYRVPNDLPQAKEPRKSRVVRLVAFGFLGGNRRLVEFVTAWSKSPWRDQFTLDIAGEIFNGDEFWECVQQTGLAEQIKFHGFVEDKKLDFLLAQADLALNLRYPTMGEASGSQLRIWANRTASVVTDIGWYNQLPDDSVLKIRYDHEEEDILSLLEKLAHDQIDIQSIADSGWRQLRRHDPHDYSAELVNWLTRYREDMCHLWGFKKQIQKVAREIASVSEGVMKIQLPSVLEVEARKMARSGNFQDLLCG